LLDPDSQTLLWVGLVNALALLLGASAAMAEAALAGLSRARLHRLVEQGLHRYRVLLPFVEHPSRYQTALVLLRVAAVVLATALVAGVLSNGLFLLTLVFFFALAETVPRRLVTGRAEEVALAAAVPLLVCATLLGPFIRLLELARGASRLSGPAPNGRNGEVREEAADGPVVVTVGEEQHVVAEEEGEMIHSIVELEEKTVRQIMVPRTDIIALPATATLLEAIDRVIAHGYSRLPVYEGTVDNIIGILYAKDLFRAVRSGQTGESVRHFLRPAYFIPESKRVDELLHEMQQKRIHIAIVVDEYGGTAGLVTIEDLLEEIVGEIEDEYDRGKQAVIWVSPDEVIVDGTMTIDDVNDLLGLHLVGEEVDRIGGLVLERLGALPSVGDQVELNGARLSVVATDGRRVRQVRVTRLAAPETQGAAE